MSAPSAANRRSATYRRRVTGPDLLAAAGASAAGAALSVALIIALAVPLGQTWVWPFALVIAAPLLVAPVLWTLFRRGWCWNDLGFVRSHVSLWHLAWEVPVLWVGAVATTVALGSLLSIAPSTASGSTSEAAGFGIVAFVLTALVVVVVAPAVEEICFRRVLFGWVEQRAGAVIATLVSATAFGLVHFVPAVMLLQFFIGLGAGLLVRRHRTLWASLALHAFNNGIVTIGVGVPLFGGG